MSDESVKDISAEFDTIQVSAERVKIIYISEKFQYYSNGMCLQKG